MFTSRFRALASRSTLAVLAAAGTAIVVGGVSSASIPDKAGAIHGCYRALGSSYPLSLINTSIQPHCPSGYSAINWDASPPGIGYATGGATSSTSSGATCTMGQITLFAQVGAYVPNNYVVAKGQTLSIASWPTLFALIGTTYGGDGKSTFKLPSIQSLAPNHMTYAICVNGIFP